MCDSAGSCRWPASLALWMVACSPFDGRLLSPLDAGAGNSDTREDAAAPFDATSETTAALQCGAACEICNGGDDDDDGRIDEGEAALLCPLEHATGACFEGRCIVAQCVADSRDCDGDARTGCEARIGAVETCGGCGHDCTALENTVEVVCGEELRCEIAACAVGYFDCDDDASNGCEARLSDVLNCGGCARAGDNEACTDLPGALTTSCATGACEVTLCLPGFADCNGMAADGCEREIAQDGCCPGDPDSDVDGVLDCLDACPGDPGKSEPGACGCGISDADLDVDGIADCRTDCWGFPSNFDPFDGALDFTVEASLTCSPTIDTSKPGAEMISGWCNGAAPTPVVQSQVSGPALVVVPLRGLTLAAGRTLRLLGDKPVLLAIEGDARIDGTIDAGSDHRARPGAGATVACGEGSGRAGTPAVNDGAAGGGGGGFGTAGGRGGFSDDGPGGSAGVPEGSSMLVPLRAGCSGGRGGHEGGNGGGAGGFGGGAVQLAVTGRLLVSGTGVIAAGGGGGVRGTSARDGGGGGGSGGAVLIEANTTELEPGSWVTAHGGSGAAGNYSSGVCSDANGRDASRTGQNTLPGGRGCAGSGDGGAGAATGGSAGPGSGASSNDAGGGGGGGLGRVVMRPLAGSLCAREL